MTSGGATFLATLAERVGVLASYVDNDGVLRQTSDDVKVAVLAALGIDAADETAARSSLQQIEQSERARPFAPVRLLRAGAPAI